MKREINPDKASKLCRMYTSDFSWFEAYARQARVPVTAVIHDVVLRIRKEFGYSFLMKGC